MRVFVTGATGLLGQKLCPALSNEGHEVLALSRRVAPSENTPGVRWIRGDVSIRGAWREALAGTDAVIHLAGEPIAGRRWTRAQKERLVRSRVESTRLIVDALREAKARLQTLVCASATGVYGSRGEEELDERSPPGNGFLPQLCLDWESAARAAEDEGVRVVSLRFGVVLSARGGALPRMLLPFRLGIGGPLGPGDRWFPWIHEDDAVGLVRFALSTPLRGVVNAVAPGVARMSEFATTLGRLLKRPALLPLPLALLRVAVGELADHLSPGQRVAPRFALEGGFVFQHPDLEGALRACLDRA